MFKVNTKTSDLKVNDKIYIPGFKVAKSISFLYPDKRSVQIRNGQSKIVVTGNSFERLIKDASEILR